ncbi:unnamed protein product [Darwinula stevensoni]|uniref:Histone deacetylase 8 n=1 Tax=Darwinula stevensoni TaxID=69355 RepID=A0A7R9ACT2_9CRUS|nr:unnamed protein product [Darwinula stevensoni]CAG0900303.1 unnamed protein product [Darwinula stevensoni]
MDASVKRRTSYVHDEVFLSACDQYPAVLGRASRVHSLIASYGLLNHMDIIPCQAATEDDILNFHSLEYVETLKMGDSEELQESSAMSEFGLEYDCPLVDDLWKTIQFVAGGTLTAACALTEGKSSIAINWCDTAIFCRDEAAGFCYVNDVVLGILKLRCVFHRVMYIDLDAHHGDGVEVAFNYSDKILNVSIHCREPGFFPGTGDTESVGLGRAAFTVFNIPLRTGARDSSFLHVFLKIVPRLWEVWKPDAVVVQCGADGITGDPLGDSNLTPVALAEALKTILSWNSPTLILGGGGYNVPNTARCWTYLTSVILGLSLHSDIPEHEYFSEYGPGFQLEITPGLRNDLNTPEYLEKVLSDLNGKCR